VHANFYDTLLKELAEPGYSCRKSSKDGERPAPKREAPVLPPRDNKSSSRTTGGNDVSEEASSTYEDEGNDAVQDEQEFHAVTWAETAVSVSVDELNMDDSSSDVSDDSEDYDDLDDLDDDHNEYAASQLDALAAIIAATQNFKNPDFVDSPGQCRIAEIQEIRSSMAVGVGT